MARTRPASSDPINPAPAQTPEQLAEAARTLSIVEAHRNRRAAHLLKALTLAQKLTSRITPREYDNSFTVMFGDESQQHCSFSGPGIVELHVELAYSKARSLEELETDVPTLRYVPRCYSLGSEATLESCAAQGNALIEAARFGQTLNALTA